MVVKTDGYLVKAIKGYIGDKWPRSLSLKYINLLESAVELKVEMEKHSLEELDDPFTESDIIQETLRYIYNEIVSTLIDLNNHYYAGIVSEDDDSTLSVKRICPECFSRMKDHSGLKINLSSDEYFQQMLFECLGCGRKWNVLGEVR